MQRGLDGKSSKMIQAKEEEQGSEEVEVEEEEEEEEDEEDDEEEGKGCVFIVSTTLVET